MPDLLFADTLTKQEVIKWPLRKAARCRTSHKSALQRSPMTHVFEHVISIRKQVSVRKFGFIIAHNKNDILLTTTSSYSQSPHPQSPDLSCTYCRLPFWFLDNLHRRILADLGSDLNHDSMRMTLVMTVKLMVAWMVYSMSVSLLMLQVAHKMVWFLVFEVGLHRAVCYEEE